MVLHSKILLVYVYRYMYYNRITSRCTICDTVVY